MWTATKTFLLTLALGLTLALPAQAAVLAPFTASYSASHGFFGLGTASFQLEPEGTCWRWHGSVNPNALASVLIGDVTEDSRFCVMPDGSLQALAFQTTESGSTDDNYSLAFNWATNQVDYQAKSQEQKLAVPVGAIDPFLLQLAARRWLAGAGDDPSHAKPQEFTVVDKNKVRHYTLAAQNGGRIKTPAGNFDTVRISRVGGGDHKLVFWTAPKLDFLPVRVEHQTKGKTELRFDLTKLTKPKPPAAATAKN